MNKNVYKDNYYRFVSDKPKARSVVDRSPEAIAHKEALDRAEEKQLADELKEVWEE